MSMTRKDYRLIAASFNKTGKRVLPRKRVLLCHAIGDMSNALLSDNPDRFDAAKFVIASTKDWSEGRMG